MEGGNFAVPGDLIVSSKDYKSGEGVMAYKKVDFRSVTTGTIVNEPTGKGKTRINVISGGVSAKSYIINISDVIIGRITRITLNQAFVDILSLGEIELPCPVKAVIRREDIRETEVDKVVVADFFKPLDIVKASVISLGDNKSYFLSTSKPTMGVVLPRKKDLSVL